MRPLSEEEAAYLRGERFRVWAPFAPGRAAERAICEELRASGRVALRVDEAGDRYVRTELGELALRVRAAWLQSGSGRCSV